MPPHMPSLFLKSGKNNPTVNTPTTWNSSDKSPSIGLTGSNLIATASAVAVAGARSVASKTTGKWHWEVTMNLAGNQPDSTPGIGISDQASHNLTTRPGEDAYSCAYQQSGAIRIFASTATTTAALSNGDTVAIELDLDNYDIYFQKFGGARLGPFDISALSGAAGFYATVGFVFPSDQCTANFGATPFLIEPTELYAMGFG